MKKIIFLLIIAAIVAGGWFTNPTIEQHREKVEDIARIAITSTLEDEVKANNGGLLGTIITAFVGDKIVEKGVEAFVGNKMEYHDYLLGSTATIDGHVVSVGVFGKVFTANADTIKEKMKDSIKDGIKDIGKELKNSLF
ncbi:MAG: hypothetical protein Q4D33_05945 [Prevotellaceae bacterium]|nr:hypothetical protein [Prevotellaceae bacterium]